MTPTARTITVGYGPVRALPLYPGEVGGRGRFREIFTQGGYPGEATRELEGMGFHVQHPSRHPNGSGGVCAKVWITSSRELPRALKVWHG